MGNIERRFEQEQTFGHLTLLNRYIFDKNMLFVQEIAQCVLKEKLLEHKPFYAKSSYIK